MRRLQSIFITSAYLLSVILPLANAGSWSYGLESLVFAKKAAAKTVLTAPAKTAKHIAVTKPVKLESTTAQSSGTLPRLVPHVVLTSCSNASCCSNPEFRLFRKRAPPVSVTA